MKIVVLGWGSLIWNPRELKINENWQKNGPFLPIEFARISKDSRLTLVIKKDSKPVQVLWNEMKSESLESAREDLKKREGTPNLNRIGFVNLKKRTSCSQYDGISDVIIKWAKNKKIDGVVWTDLGVKFKNKIGKDLNPQNVIEYLRNLPEEKQKLAKEYIIKAPSQIVTEYRLKIESDLNWCNRNKP